ncbi:MAG TPA: HWE histidine kinase domain-containing protein [Sphingobium sp.]
MLAELNHRVRNILDVIRGLIRQSQPDNDKVKEFVKLVDGRIHALARAPILLDRTVSSARQPQCGGWILRSLAAGHADWRRRCCFIAPGIM